MLSYKEKIMFSKKIKKKLKKINNKYFFIPLVLLLIIVISIAFLQIYSKGKINQGIKIAGFDVSNRTVDEAYKILSENITSEENLYLVNEDHKYEISLKDLNFSYDYSKSVQKAYKSTRSGNFFYDLGRKINLIYIKENLGLEIIIDENILEEKIKEFGKDFEIKPIEPNISLLNGIINVQKGTKGVVIDYLKLRADIGKSLAFLEKNNLIIPLKEEGKVLNEIDIQIAKDRAAKLIGKSLILKFNDLNFNLNDQVLISFLNPQKEYFDEIILSKAAQIALDINREPQNSVFTFEESRVKEFTPSLDGYEVENDILENMIIGNLRTLEQSEQKIITLDIPVKVTKPKIQNKDVNNLGIETLLGKGTSKFSGSITNRIYNIGHASEKFVGILVAPNENFSFNQTLGDVSQETGYKQAYVIKEGKTILGDGGGVCQVSTTLFRAALNAGLPILERQPHAYRVGYYEQDSPPGLDATVYAPHPDLVIKNDTPKHILIQSVYSEKNRTLAFEIYGTDDGRVSNVTKPLITSQTPPPEDLYQDDPTLPIGTIKQVEHKAWGAKVKFDYLVERNGEVIFKKTFYSNYQPWQAIYLRGTMPQ
jgi:vancomycin resistance protein YoaR